MKYRVRLYMWKRYDTFIFNFENINMYSTDPTIISSKFWIFFLEIEGKAYWTGDSGSRVPKWIIYHVSSLESVRFIEFDKIIC